MLWLWIIGGIVLLLFLFCMLRIGVRITVQETAAAWVTVGLIRIQVAPSKPKKSKKKAEPKKKKTTDGKDKLKQLKKLPKPTLEDIRSAIDTLGPPLKRALRRTRRGIRIHPLQLSVTVGGAHNPAEAAELYGLIHSAVWIVMPVAEELLVIPEPSIHVGLDFDAAGFKAAGEVGISIRVGTIIALGFGIGIPALKWFLSWLKKRKPEVPPKLKDKKDRPTVDTAA